LKRGQRRLCVIIVVIIVIASLLGGIYYYYYYAYHAVKTQRTIPALSFSALIVSSGLTDTNTYNYIVVLAPGGLAAGIRSIIGQHMAIAMNVRGVLNTTEILKEVSEYVINGWASVSISGEPWKISFKDILIEPYFSGFRPYIYILYYMHNTPAKIALILNRDTTPDKAIQIAGELRRVKGPVIIFVGNTIISLNYQVSTYTQRYTTCTGTSCSAKSPMTIKRLMITAYIIGNTSGSGEHTFTIKLRNISLTYYTPSNILSIKGEKNIRLNNTTAVYLGDKLVIIDHSDNYEDKASWTIQYRSSHLATFTIYADKPSGVPATIISLDGKELVRIYFHI